MSTRLVSRDFRRSRSSEHVGKFDGFSMHSGRYTRKNKFIRARNSSIFMTFDNSKTEVILIYRSIYRSHF